MKFIGYMRRAYRAIGERYDRIEDKGAFEGGIVLCAFCSAILIAQLRQEKKTINPDDFAIFPPLKPKEGPADVDK